MTEMPLDGTASRSVVNYETRTGAGNVKNSLIFFHFGAMLNSWAANEAAQPVTP